MHGWSQQDVNSIVAARVCPGCVLLCKRWLEVGRPHVGVVVGGAAIPVRRTMSRTVVPSVIAFF